VGVEREVAPQTFRSTSLPRVSVRAALRSAGAAGEGREAVWVRAGSVEQRKRSRKAL
jgi:hypothetical protein